MLTSSILVEVHGMKLTFYHVKSERPVQSRGPQNSHIGPNRKLVS